MIAKKSKTERLRDLFSEFSLGIKTEDEMVMSIKQLFEYTEGLLPLEERKEAFRLLVLKFSDKYSPTLLTAFYKHWTEPNAKGLMKFELQETWSLPGRLATWARNDRKFSIINNLNKKG